MVSDLSEAFLYVNSAKELWDELSERFRESNGPLLYQLEKDIADLYQGGDSVAVYYTKLKKLWDELADLFEVPVCASGANCSAIKRTFEIDQRRKLMQFLMHLNDDYDSVRGQILLLVPLPTVNKAYAMVQREELSLIALVVHVMLLPMSKELGIFLLGVQILAQMLFWPEMHLDRRRMSERNLRSLGSVIIVNGLVILLTNALE